jgi:hypothetical protein
MSKFQQQQLITTQVGLKKRELLKLILSKCTIRGCMLAINVRDGAGEVTIRRLADEVLHYQDLHAWAAEWLR